MRSTGASTGLSLRWLIWRSERNARSEPAAADIFQVDTGLMNNLSIAGAAPSFHLPTGQDWGGVVHAARDAGQVQTMALRSRAGVHLNFDFKDHVDKA